MKFCRLTRTQLPLAERNAHVAVWLPSGSVDQVQSVPAERFGPRLLVFGERSHRVSVDEA